MQYLILNCTKQGKRLTHCLTNIQQFYLRQNMKQNMERDLKF